MEALVRYQAMNLKWIFDHASKQQRKEAPRRYRGLNGIANGIRKKHRLTLEQVCGVMAVLSPQADWSAMVALTERLIDAYAIARHSSWDGQMDAAATGELAHLFQLDPELGLALNQLGAVQGRPLSRLGCLRDKAIWIRLYVDRMQEPIREVGASGEFVRATAGTPVRTLRWPGISAIATAIGILEADGFLEIADLLGPCHRVRNLYNNLANPWHRELFVAVDRHLISAAHGRPTGSDSLEVAEAFGGYGAERSEISGMIGSYGFYVSAVEVLSLHEGYRVAAEVESICSEVARLLFRNASHSDGGYAVGATIRKAANHGLIPVETANVIVFEWAQNHDSSEDSNSWSKLPGSLRTRVPESQWNEFKAAHVRAERERRERFDSDNPNPTISIDELVESKAFTGMPEVLSRIGVSRISRSQLLRADYGDEVPDPWTGELDVRLPVELTDNALRVQADLKRRRLGLDEYR